MRTWRDNLEAVARALWAKKLAHDGISEEQLAADVDMWWHRVAADLECGNIDETGEYVGGEIDHERNLAAYRDWMRAIRRAARSGRLRGSEGCYRGTDVARGPSSACMDGAANIIQAMDSADIRPPKFAVHAASPRQYLNLFPKDLTVLPQPSARSVYGGRTGQIDKATTSPSIPSA